MDFRFAKRNQFPVRIDIRVDMGDFQCKRELGFSDEVFTRAEKLLRIDR